jgi:hypothetical protein
MKNHQAEKSGVAQQSDPSAQAQNFFKEQVQHPGILFCIDKPEEWNEAENFSRKMSQEYPSLKVLVFYVHGKADSKSVAPHLLVVDKRDFTLLGKEKQPLKQWLKENYFDLLLVFTGKSNKRCRKLSAAVRAKLKAGRVIKGEEPWLDITLGKPQEKLSYDAFYQELKIYFKQLNIHLK